MKTSELFNAKESSKTLKILKEESRMKKLLTTTLIILILFVAVPFSHAVYEVSQLTNDTNDKYPQINDDGIVVWEGGGDIYRYTGGDPEKISNNPEYTNTAPQIINQHGLVVWQGCNSFDCEIFLYNGYSAVNISNDPEHHDEYPQINKRGQVVWVKDYFCDDGLCSDEQRKKGQEVMLYDPYEKTLANISNRYGDDEDPQINDIGEVVWSGYHQGNSGNQHDGRR